MPTDDSSSMECGHVDSVESSVSWNEADATDGAVELSRVIDSLEPEVDEREWTDCDEPVEEAPEAVVPVLKLTSCTGRVRGSAAREPFDRLFRAVVLLRVESEGFLRGGVGAKTILDCR